MTVKFQRTLASLEKISQFILEFARKNKLNDRIVNIITLVVEELFTNAVKYNPENTNDISVNLSIDSDKLIVSIVDYDVEPFDIRQIEAYDFRKKLNERRVGGLGIPLVKKMMDRIDYEYKNRQSNITLVKYLEKEHA